MGRSDRRNLAGVWVLRWGLLAVLWLALTDTRAASELLAGAVVAALGATFATLVTRVGSPRTAKTSLRVARLGPQRIAHPLIRLVPDTVLLAGALWRRLVLRRDVRGSWRLDRHTRPVALQSTAGRFATEAWGSLTPNRYVVGVDEAQGTILVHELVRGEAPLEPFGRP